MNKNYKIFILFLLSIVGCNQIQSSFENAVKNTIRIEFYDNRLAGKPKPYRTITDKKTINEIIKKIEFGKKVKILEMPMPKLIVFVTPNRNYRLGFGRGRFNCEKGAYECPDEILKYLNEISVKTENNGVSD